MPMPYEDPPKKLKGRYPYTIKSLRLDLQAAEDGKTWKILPVGFRAKECGTTYPLPSNPKELQRMTTLFIQPTTAHRRYEDSGVTYLKRAVDRWKECQLNRRSALLDAESNRNKIRLEKDNFHSAVKIQKQNIRDAVKEVRAVAQESIASLHSLFNLSRKVIEGQLEAHLAGEKWQSEKISAQAGRQLATIVMGGVKAFGLQTDQKESAKEAIALEEAAANIKASRETVKLGPGTNSKTEH